MESIRVGIVGCGRISGLHALGYRGREDARIEAVCNTKRARAREKAKAWGVEKVYADYQELLAEPFAGLGQDLTEEDIQARIRGNILMALSNKLGWLVLTTGKESEMGVGYATLYGDMADGFAVIKDVPKMLVYELAEHVNAREGHAVIPQRILDKAPTHRRVTP